MAWKRIHVANSYTGTLFYVRYDIIKETIVCKSHSVLESTTSDNKARHTSSAHPSPTHPALENLHILVTEFSEVSCLLGQCFLLAVCML